MHLPKYNEDAPDLSFLLMSALCLNNNSQIFILLFSTAVKYKKL